MTPPEIDYTNPLAFTDVLIGDVNECFQALQSDPTDSNRRALIRAVFAAVEGMVWIHKQDLLKDRPDLTPPLTDAEATVLREETYFVTDGGAVKTRPSFVPLKENLKLTLTLCTRRSDTGFAPDFADRGWSDLSSTILVRHRLTHPKDTRDLLVTDAEVAAANSGFAWFLAQGIRILRAREQWLRQSTDEIKKRTALLLSVKRGTDV